MHATTAQASHRCSLHGAVIDRGSGHARVVNELLHVVVMAVVIVNLVAGDVALTAPLSTQGREPDQG